MKNLIRKLLKEAFEDKKEDKDIVCDNCGWSWDKKDSELWDMYVCHECGHDNTEKYLHNH
jgi:DNA-directed RNA polymerase subunit RPC12/RpoP